MATLGKPLIGKNAHIERMGRNAYFWSRVDKKEGGCWEWDNPDNTGYGRMSVNCERILVHRFSFELAKGPIPENLCVLHKCDNRRCVNPDHLFLGTYQDNRDDCIRKGRANNIKAEAHPNSKLTAAAIREIRFLWASGRFKQWEIGQRFGVAQATIFKITKGLIWQSV